MDFYSFNISNTNWENIFIIGYLSLMVHGDFNLFDMSKIRMDFLRSAYCHALKQTYMFYNDVTLIIAMLGKQLATE